MRITPRSRVDVIECVELFDPEPGPSFGVKSRPIFRGKTAIRSRSPSSTRFSDPSPFQLIRKGEGAEMNPFGEDDYAWLAMEWFFSNGRRMPSKHEILNGIIEGAVA